MVAPEFGGFYVAGLRGCGAAGSPAPWPRSRSSRWQLSPGFAAPALEPGERFAEPLRSRGPRSPAKGCPGDGGRGERLRRGAGEKRPRNGPGTARCLLEGFGHRVETATAGWTPPAADPRAEPPIRRQLPISHSRWRDRPGAGRARGPEPAPRAPRGAPVRAGDRSAFLRALIHGQRTSCRLIKWVPGACGTGRAGSGSTDFVPLEFPDAGAAEA